MSNDSVIDFGNSFANSSSSKPISPAVKAAMATALAAVTIGITVGAAAYFTGINVFAAVGSFVGVSAVAGISLAALGGITLAAVTGGLAFFASAAIIAASAASAYSASRAYATITSSEWYIIRSWEKENVVDTQAIADGCVAVSNAESEKINAKTDENLSKIRKLLAEREELRSSSVLSPIVKVNISRCLEEGRLSSQVRQPVVGVPGNGYIVRRDGSGAVTAMGSSPQGKSKLGSGPFSWVRSKLKSPKSPRSNSA